MRFDAVRGVRLTNRALIWDRIHSSEARRGFGEGVVLESQGSAGNSGSLRSPCFWGLAFRRDGFGSSRLLGQSASGRRGYSVRSRSTRVEVRRAGARGGDHPVVCKAPTRTLCSRPADLGRGPLPVPLEERTSATFFKYPTITPLVFNHSDPPRKTHTLLVFTHMASELTVTRGPISEIMASTPNGERTR